MNMRSHTNNRIVSTSQINTTIGTPMCEDPTCMHTWEVSSTRRDERHGVVESILVCTKCGGIMTDYDPISTIQC